MPTLLTDLLIDRVDFVDEGADTAAFIELCKRKENSKTMTLEEILSKIKPEHAEEITKAISTANAEVAKAASTIETLTATNATLTKRVGEVEAIVKAKDTEIAKLSGKTAETKTEEEVLKGLPQEVRETFEKLKLQKESAEAELRKAKEAEAHAEAVTKAASLKALPVDTAKLTEIVKSCSPEMLDMLSSINSAIEGTVLSEVGKSTSAGSSSPDAWAKIELKAEEIAKAENLTKQKAIGEVVKRCPDLYKEYLKGGAN